MLGSKQDLIMTFGILGRARVFDAADTQPDLRVFRRLLRRYGRVVHLRSETQPAAECLQGHAPCHTRFRALDSRDFGDVCGFPVLNRGLILRTGKKKVLKRVIPEKVFRRKCENGLDQTENCDKISKRAFDVPSVPKSSASMISDEDEKVIIILCLRTQCMQNYETQ